MTTLATYGTRLLETTVHAASDGGYWWRRRLGSRATDAFATCALPSVAAASPHSGRVVTGRGDATERWYATTGRSSLASEVLGGGAPSPRALQGLSCFGAALRALHDIDAAELALPVRPRPASRMLRWFDGRATTPLGARFHLNAVHELGRAALERLQARLEDLPSISTAVALHGAPGLGAVVLSDDGGVELLAGEDVALGPSSHDVNWVVGELTELSWASGAPGAWQEAIDAFLEAYGGDGEVDRELIALRVLTHAHDFVSYVDWQEEMQSEYLRFVGHLLGRAR
ncbi:hypothetical protein [Microbacterium hibisci]|uniref:hypothetical protein n=1 Tax=Microbacterium hibisci TaxID=2036000 RepID=UPI001944F05B|nr:hypothetical protein [Microbacterium hibisci]